ncbi:MAG: DUF4349 domain-containing protein [Gemmatimonadales bacterium]
MKARTNLLAITLCALYACGGDSSPATDGSTASGKPVASPSALGASMGMPARDIGNASGEAAGKMAAAPPAEFGAQSADAAASQPGSGADPLQQVTSGTIAAPSMIIRTGQAFIEVEKVDPAILKLRQLTAQVGGFITNSSISGGHDQIRQATLEIKIPAGKYDEAVSSLSTVGKVETVNTSAQDVGEEFVDVTARVNNARRLEDRLINLLSNRTGKLDEVLRVERELARVREEIERYEGRLRFLRARVALSTLTITVHEPAPILGSNPGENPIAAALRRAWRNFVALIAAVIASLGILIPLALVAAGGWIGYRRWKRTRS